MGEEGATKHQAQRSEHTVFDLWVIEAVELDQFQLMFKKSFAIIALLRSTFWHLSVGSLLRDFGLQLDNGMCLGQKQACVCTSDPLYGVFHILTVQTASGRRIW